MRSVPTTTDEAEVVQSMAVFYKEVHQEVKIFEAAHHLRLPILLKGPTGCGKSRFVAYMAKRFEAPLVQISCNEDTSSSDLLGRYLLRANETYWQDGPVTRAVRAGAFLYLDEISEAREDVIVLLHSLTDDRRELYIDRTNEKLSAPVNFQLIMSFNPGYQSNFRRLKPSTRQRLVTLEFGYPAEKLEVEIVRRESGADGSVCQNLVMMAQKIRSMSELALEETVSTRLLVFGASLIREGIPARVACDVGIFQAMTDDCEVREVLQDLAALYF